MITRDEWGDRVATGKRENAADVRPQLEGLRQAAVKAELLTGNEHWNWFLSYIQDAIETTEKHRAAFQAVMADSKTVSHESLLEAKIGIAECSARIEAWKVVMELPKDFIEMGEQAKNLIDRLDGKGDDES